MARYIGRENVRKRLEPLAGQAGRTDYAGGSARIETADETLAVTPPFGLEHEASYDRVELGPLLEALAREHTVGAILVRRGGYHGARGVGAVPRPDRVRGARRRPWRCDGGRRPAPVAGVAAARAVLRRSGSAA